ncbi:hypothetical protein AFCDBAGC_4906 [Methylobacterium cerastii]|uniref:Uncharacterized protein n=1 Tax=Methylobacterium cerastii TaxID=932741 RepID=A0ABQ4QPN4_9HYPH|nr:hypothetical protein [Methylobacterium cerastii]GJD47021.1 hypothetical protein AFCDBAGC_4906 [Methylobacterium cerastii]
MTEHPDHIAYGTPGALRQFVGECLHMAAFYASMGVDYGAVGDDVGLELSTRKATAAMRQAISVMTMLKEANGTLRQKGKPHEA